MGYVDEDGYLYLTDRSTFMIVSGGVNIYPQEAENLLIMHPKLVDAAVFGVPNDEFGEEVKAVVQPADGIATRPERQAIQETYPRTLLAGPHVTNRVTAAERGLPPRSFRKSVVVIHVRQGVDAR